jgi:hypothetical protein
MNAIRQYIDVKNNKLNIVLPDDFTAKRVEVIILPSEHSIEIPQWHKDIVLERIKNPFPLTDAFEMAKELEKEYSENL